MTRLRLDDRASNLGRSKGVLPLRHCVQTGPGAHRASSPMGTGAWS